VGAPTAARSELIHTGKVVSSATKERYTALTAAMDIFTLVDAMPMRQREMREEEQTND